MKSGGGGGVLHKPKAQGAKKLHREPVLGANFCNILLPLECGQRLGLCGDLVRSLVLGYVFLFCWERRLV